MTKKQIASIAAIPTLTLTSINETQKRALTLAREMHAAVADSMDKYRSFCIYARANLMPKETRDILKLAGFGDDVAGRICNVATVLPEPEYQKFIKGELSFNVALDKAREEKERLATVAGKTIRRKVVKSLFPKLFSLATKITEKQPIKKDAKICSMGKNGLLILIPAASMETKIESSDWIISVSVTAKEKK